MMRFTFTDTPSFLADPNDPIYHLERTVDRLDYLSAEKRLPLLYNDAKNYLDADLTPYEAWYIPRIRAVQGYTGQDWLAFGQHLAKKSPSLGILCTTIHTNLQKLVEGAQTKSLPLPLFCSTLASIDNLFHILLPSHLEDIQDPAIHRLLSHFGQRALP